MPTTIDKAAVSDAYEQVRDDSNESVAWATFKFDGTQIVLDSTGADYAEFVSRLGADERMFCYVRVTTGDELSKRAKFCFITWAGPEVSTLKKAKLSVDKAQIKNIIRSFAVEILAENLEDVDYDTVRTQLIKAGGANYGTGAGS